MFLIHALTAISTNEKLAEYNFHQLKQKLSRHIRSSVKVSIICEFSGLNWPKKDDKVVIDFRPPDAKV